MRAYKRIYILSCVVSVQKVFAWHENGMTTKQVLFWACDEFLMYGNVKLLLIFYWMWRLIFLLYLTFIKIILQQFICKIK